MAPLEGQDQVFFAPHSEVHKILLTDIFFDKVPSGELLGKNLYAGQLCCSAGRSSRCQGWGSRPLNV